MRHLVPKTSIRKCVEIIIPALTAYFTLAVPRLERSLELVAAGVVLTAGGVVFAVAVAGATGPLGTGRGALDLPLRPSRKLCQKIRIGLAIKTDE